MPPHHHQSSPRGQGAVCANLRSLHLDCTCGRRVGFASSETEGESWGGCRHLATALKYKRFWLARLKRYTCFPPQSLAFFFLQLQPLFYSGLRSNERRISLL